MMTYGNGSQVINMQMTLSEWWTSIGGIWGLIPLCLVFGIAGHSVIWFLSKALKEGDFKWIRLVNRISLTR